MFFPQTPNNFAWFWSQRFHGCLILLQIHLCKSKINDSWYTTWSWLLVLFTDSTLITYSQWWWQGSWMSSTEKDSLLQVPSSLNLLERVLLLLTWGTAKIVFRILHHEVLMLMKIPIEFFGPEKEKLQLACSKNYRFRILWTDYPNFPNTADSKA